MMTKSGTPKAMKMMINGEEVEVKGEEILHHNTLGVEVGTNCPKGGDTGHGSRTYLKIEDLGSTDIEVNLIRDDFRETKGFELFLGGDAEYYTLIQALEFAVDELKKATKEN
jgi:hypothetical protein